MTAVKRLHIDSLSLQRLWDEHISTRQPLVIDGHLPDPGWKASRLWTDSYLRSVAGDAAVDIEVRDDGQAFGRGRKVKGTFAAVIDAASHGDSGCYLSTQRRQRGADCIPAVMAEPLTSLATDFPLRPALLGDLVPQAVNLWMGHAPDGASSGLHHDFHDNLYVLLRGRKRLRLFPPDLAARMHTHGRVRKVHDNGQIVYAGQAPVDADGTSRALVTAWRRRHRAEAELAAAEAGLKAAPRSQAAIQRVAAAEAVLDGDLDFALATGWDDEDSEDGDDQQQEPPSFSKVDLSLPDALLRRCFPGFPGKAAALVVNLEPGQMLYLPAGWFHEVTSYSGGPGTAHLAFNYWLHPPDNLVAGSGGFSRPYRNGFWTDWWASRTEQTSSEDVQSVTAPQSLAAACDEQPTLAAAGCLRKRVTATMLKCGRRRHQQSAVRRREAQPLKRVYGRHRQVHKRKHYRKHIVVSV